MPLDRVRADTDACPGALRLHAAADGPLARVRVPGGRLTGAQLAAVRELAEQWGDGHVELTSRANLQLRALREAPVAELAARLRAAGLLPSETHELVRNIAASPLAEALPVRSLDQALCADPALAELPGRFLFALDSGAGDVAFGADVAALPLGGEVAILLAGTDVGLRVPPGGEVEALLAAAHAFLAERAAQQDPAPTDRRPPVPPRPDHDASQATSRSSSVDALPTGTQPTADGLASVAVVPSSVVIPPEVPLVGPSLHEDLYPGSPPPGPGQPSIPPSEPASPSAPPPGPGEPGSSVLLDLSRLSDGDVRGSIQDKLDPSPMVSPGTTAAAARDRGDSDEGGSRRVAWRVRELTDGPARVAARTAATLGLTLGEPVAVSGPEPDEPIRIIEQPDGTVALGALIPFGRLTGVQLKVLESAVSLVFTPGRGVVLPGLTPQAARSWLEALVAAGLEVTPASRWVGVTACAGRPGCAKSLADVRADADAATRTGDGPTVQEPPVHGPAAHGPAAHGPAAHESPEHGLAAHEPADGSVVGRSAVRLLPVHWVGCARGCGSPAGPHVRVEATGEGYEVRSPRVCGVASVAEVGALVGAARKG